MACVEAFLLRRRAWKGLTATDEVGNDENDEAGLDADVVPSAVAEDELVDEIGADEGALDNTGCVCAFSGSEAEAEAEAAFDDVLPLARITGTDAVRSMACADEEPMCAEASCMD